MAQNPDSVNIQIMSSQVPGPNQNVDPTFVGSTLIIDNMHFKSKNVTEVVSEQYNSICIYPNPATGFITINGLTENSNVSVFDISGRCILKKQRTSDNRIDIQNLSAGIYYVKIPVNGKNSFYKFIKQ
jgi:hypothetical protein